MERDFLKRLLATKEEIKFGQEEISGKLGADRRDTGAQ
jgi:hypothetical protein